MKMGALGKVYKDTEVIVKQGEQGESMYVVQDGLVEVINETDHGEVLLALRGKGDLFGEIAVFEKGIRTATVRALGEARVLTIDKKNLMRRLYEDPSLAFQLMKVMSSRVRELSMEISTLRIERDRNLDE